MSATSHHRRLAGESGSALAEIALPGKKRWKMEGTILIRLTNNTEEAPNPK